MTIETYLPIFPGFYNTEFEPELIEGDNEDNLTDDCFETEFDSDAACIQMVNIIQSELRSIGLNLSLKFQSLESPRYYNFSNDSINIEIECDQDTIDQITNILLDSMEDFRIYLDNNYTSYSGFISHYSTNSEDWIKEFLNDEHMFGSVLEFILQEVFEYGEEYLHAEAAKYLREYEHLKEGVSALLSQIDTHIKGTYLEGKETTSKYVYDLFGNDDYEFTYDVEWFNERIDKVFAQIESHNLKLFL